MFLRRMTTFALDRPKTVISVAVLITIGFLAFFPMMKIDTDPENMLEADQPDRVYYNEIKERFRIKDLIVVGIFDDQDILRPESAAVIDRVIPKLLELDGIVIGDVTSFSTSYNALNDENGDLRVDPILKYLPKTQEESEKLRKRIVDTWTLPGMVISNDSKAGTAIYLPIKQKDMSYRTGLKIHEILEKELLPTQSYHIAGLPIAEDEFGFEMFLQMGVVAPAAFAFIMLIVFLLFRRAAFLVPLGIDSMCSVLWAMGLMIATGHTVHIMSSMIPVFLMPMALLDDVHVMSEFFDRYRIVRDKRRAMLEGMDALYRPMLQTSVTSAIGFASLALTPIPPVRVFGIFVAFGIMVAWLFSMMVVPAVISLMSEESLAKSVPPPNQPSKLDALLKPLGQLAFARSRLVVIGGVAIVALGFVGIQRIIVNDNPVTWFTESHRIRVADTIMNEKFAGTYMAYLVAEGQKDGTMNDGEALRYLDGLQRHLEKSPLVGKTMSAADIVTLLNLRLHKHAPEQKQIPLKEGAVAQLYFMYESGADPHDLDVFLDHERKSGLIWLQLKSGDNQDMGTVENLVSAYVAKNPPPAGISFRWSGLTYINKVWQGLMVVGMLRAVLGSFVVVFILMLFEFRSLILGVLAMIPLSASIIVSYGVLGFVGKAYDMPIAVCSSLALGLGIDFAIHFISRWKTHIQQSNDPEATNAYMFGEPGRSILRNGIVIAFGFLPLCLSYLTPYITVGVFFASLMTVATFVTLLLLPALLKLVSGRYAAVAPSAAGRTAAA